MKSINGILYFEVPELIDDYDVAEKTIKMGCLRHRDGAGAWVNVPDPLDSRRKLIQCDSIPASTVTKHSIPKLSILWQEYHEQTADDRAIRLTQIKGEYYSKSDYQHFINRGLTREESVSYADAAAWLRMMIGIRGKTQVRAMKIPGVDTKTDMLEAVLTHLQGMTDAPLGLDKVSSLQVLKRKITRFSKAIKVSEQEALDSIPHGHRKLRNKREGNQGRRKMTEDVKEVLLSMWMGMATDVKLKPEQIYSTYNAYALSGEKLIDKEAGTVYEDLPELGLTTVKSFFKRRDVMALEKYRHGTQYAKDTMRPYVLRRRPKYAFSFSSSDGMVMPFWLEMKGKNTWKRPTAYVIFDVHSGAIIGAALGENETRELLRDAFYDLYCRHQGLMPLDNQLDNFDKFFEKELQVLMGVKFCEPYHGQSKYAEGHFNTFKYSVLNQFEGFIGRHSLKNPNNKRNPDKDPIRYTMSEMDTLLQQAVEMYNNLPLKKGSDITKAEALRNINPEAETITGERAAGSFGIRRRQSIDRGYIHMTHLGEDYTYELPNYETLLPELKNGKKVCVRFMPHLLEDRIWVYNYDGSDDPEKDELLCVASLQGGTQSAPGEQRDADKQNLSRQLHRRSKYDGMVEKMAAGVPAILIPEGEGGLSLGYTSKNEIKQANELAEIPQPRPKKKEDKSDEVHKRFE